MDYINDRKYFNLLKGKKIDPINKETIQLLIENQIIVKYQPTDFILDIQREIKNSTEFESLIHFESNDYEINKELLEEIYHSLKFMIEIIESDDEWIKSEIEIELEGIIQVSEKIKFIENKHAELYSKSKKEPEFLLFTGKRSFNGYDSWTEMIIDLIMNEEKYILAYLCDEKHPLPDFYKTWLKNYRKKVLLDYCIEKHNELNNISIDKSNSKKIDTSKQVLLLESIRNINNWEEISATKKSKIVSLLIGKNADNIKDIYLNIDKKLSSNSKKFLTDKVYIENLIKDIG